MTTEELFEIARIFGIKIEFGNLRAKNQNHLGRADAKRKIITLDTSIKDTPRLLKCILAEEIGHILFPPRPGHVRYHSIGFWQTEGTSCIKAIVAQDERKALDWATSVLMPDDEFNRIMKKWDMSISEIAEHFEVLPSFMEDRIAYYRRKEKAAGRRVKWKELIRRV